MQAFESVSLALHMNSNFSSCQKITVLKLVSLAVLLTVGHRFVSNFFPLL